MEVALPRIDILESQLKNGVKTSPVRSIPLPSAFADKKCRADPIFRTLLEPSSQIGAIVVDIDRTELVFAPFESGE